MEHQQLDQQPQKEQDQGINPSNGYNYNDDTGVIPDEELKGSDADTDSGTSPSRQDENSRNQEESEDDELANEDLDIDESTGGTAI